MPDPQTSPAPATETLPPRRRSLTVPADLTVYAALAGRTPDIIPLSADPVAAALLAVRANPWSPAVVGVYVRAVVRARRSQLTRPAVAAWVRHQSAVARRRLAEPAAGVTGVALTMTASVLPPTDDSV